MTTEQLEQGKKVSAEIETAKRAVTKLKGNCNIVLDGLELTGDTKTEARCLLIRHFKEKIERLEKEFDKI